MCPHFTWAMGMIFYSLYDDVTTRRHYYGVTTMTSLPPLLWRRHYSRYDDVTTPATMTSLPPPLWHSLYDDVTTRRHYYGVTTMTSLTPLLWRRHYPRYYDVTTPATMTTSLLPLWWRYYPRYDDVITPATMTSLTLLLLTFPSILIPY